MDVFRTFHWQPWQPRRQRPSGLQYYFVVALADAVWPPWKTPPFLQNTQRLFTLYIPTPPHPHPHLHPTIPHTYIAPTRSHPAPARINTIKQIEIAPRLCACAALDRKRLPVGMKIRIVQRGQAGMIATRRRYVLWAGGWPSSGGPNIGRQAWCHESTSGATANRPRYDFLAKVSVSSRPWVKLVSGAAESMARSG